MGLIESRVGQSTAVAKPLEAGAEEIAVGALVGARVTRSMSRCRKMPYRLRPELRVVTLLLEAVIV